MAKNNWTGIAVIAGIIILWLLWDREKKIKELLDLQREIDVNKTLDEEIKIKLANLISEPKIIDPIIANELVQITALVEIKQDGSAILKLCKIIENLLKRHFDGSDELKEALKKKSRLVFADYLDLARKAEVISNEEFHLVSVLRLIRNDEAHSLEVKKEKSSVIASFIAGLGIVVSLCNMMSKKHVIKTSVL